MLVGMGEGQHNGKPLKTMKDLYLCFERDINAIVEHVSNRGGPVTQGIVFAELLDAVEQSKVALREAMEKAQEKLAAADAAREADRLRAIQERIESEVARPTKATEAPRRGRKPAEATAGRKKPGVGRKPAVAVATGAPKRRGRPPKNR